MSWMYKGEPFLSAPEDAFGFVYLITNTHTGQQYIGKKQFFSNLTKRVKGRKNRVHYKKESDWQQYWGSCNELKEDVARLGEDSFVREILEMCSTKGELTFGELEYQIKRDVLKAKLPNGRQAYYNRNIMNRFFAKADVVAEETKRRLAESTQGKAKYKR